VKFIDGLERIGLTMEDENEIREKMIAIIREKARQCYSDRIVDYGTNPVNCGAIKDPDGYAEGKNECGGNIGMFLRVKDGKIEESKFVANGCIFTVAACNAATEMARGKTIQGCLKINQTSIATHLGGLPEDHMECAFLAALVFQRALRNYIVTNKKQGT
jgi:nitrogen fixation NifU-like protein